MNEFKKDIQEDAKSDWMKVVNKHKKRQKGLPALSKLNTDAGNVEHNISMFNKMAQPSNSVSAENSGSDTVAMSESLDKEQDNVIQLEYSDIPVEVVTKRGNPRGYYSPSMGQWYPDENVTKTILVSWTYSVDKISVIEFLQDLPEVQLELNYDELSDEEFDKELLDNLDYLVYKHEEKLLDEFRDEAIEDAQENFSYDYEYTFDESYQKKSDNDDIMLDDKFDMSMRTLL